MIQQNRQASIQVLVQKDIVACKISVNDAGLVDKMERSRYLKGPTTGVVPFVVCVHVMLRRVLQADTGFEDSMVQ